MRSMKQQTAIIGRSLLNAISRNFKEAARKGNVSKRGNLSSPCPNPSQISIHRTRVTEKIFQNKFQKSCCRILKKMKIGLLIKAVMKK